MRNGATGYDPEELLTSTPWLHRLASRLVGDPAAAEDAAQAALVLALEHPPEAHWPLRRWLAGVLRNVIRQERRGTLRRIDRERARAESPQAGTEEAVDIAARLELQGQLIACVRALAEPYRSTVVMRFLEELTPTEIAARQGVPVKTVHTRLERALARLRGRLDREHGSRAAWATVLVPGLDPKLLWAGTSVLPSTLLLPMTMGTLHWTGAALVAATLAVFLWHTSSSDSEIPIQVASPSVVPPAPPAPSGPWGQDTSSPSARQALGGTAAELFSEEDELSTSEGSGSMRAPAPAFSTAGVDEASPDQGLGPAPEEEGAWRPLTAADWKYLGSLDRTPVPDSVFDAKYPPDMKPDELRDAHLRTAREMMGLAQLHASERQRTGLTEILSEPPREADGSFQSGWLGSDNSWPLYSFRGGHDVGQGKVEITWLPFDQYPQLYDLRDEWHYLNRRMGSGSAPHVERTTTYTPY